MAKQTYERHVALFEGEPFTDCHHDELQRPVIDVYIQELTPENVKNAETLTGLAMLVSVIGLFIAMVEQPIFYLPGLVAIWIGGGSLQQYLYQALRTNTRVLFTPTEFKVLRRGQWNVYDRHLKHSFVMLKHDEARQEREKQECQARAAQAKGQHSPPRRFYDDSFHMVLEYFGQRHDIATVFDEKRARAVIARLQACDSMMDSHIKMGDSHTLSPEEEWGAQPGGLPGQHR